MAANYDQLEQHFKVINDLEGAKAVLHWDTAVMMPSGGEAGRTEQMATLEAIIHDHLTSLSVAHWLSEVQGEMPILNPWQQSNVRSMERLYKHATVVDTRLVQALTRAGMACELTWREARKENDFASFAPKLTEVLRLVREIANAKSEAFHVAPYDALLDQFDPGSTVHDIDAIFSPLEAFLQDFLPQVLEHQKSLPKPIQIQGPFPIAKQKVLGLRCMELLGFNFQEGRLDESHHPFCGGVPGDVRITTRYNEQEFLTSLMGVQHEVGHAMYENNLPLEWRNQPVGKPLGMGIHESQSLLVEMQACRSRTFLSYLLPHIKEIFAGSGPAWELDNVVRLATWVEPSLIRVDADEVTYPLHVMIRYKLEKQLISGELEVKELPDAWNSLMQSMLGITPDSDANGCMQDIHWTDGSFGYFPTYTLGAIYAAQFFATALETYPTILDEIAHGKFTLLMQWLREHVHRYGSLYTTKELVIKATGRPIDVGHYQQHLQHRYLNRI